MVSRTPRPHFTQGKDPVLIVQEAGWAPGPVWSTGIKLLIIYDKVYVNNAFVVYCINEIFL